MKGFINLLRIILFSFIATCAFIASIFVSTSIVDWLTIKMHILLQLAMYVYYVIPLLSVIVMTIAKRCIFKKLPTITIAIGFLTNFALITYFAYEDVFIRDGVGSIGGMMGAVVFWAALIAFVFSIVVSIVMMIIEKTD